jgi:hypothetical protein
LAALFARVRGAHAAADSPGSFRFGLRLVSWDATMLDAPDSDANAAAFIRSRSRKGAGAFPKVRLMTLIEVGTHAVIDAVFGAGLRTGPGPSTPGLSGTVDAAARRPELPVVSAVERGRRDRSPPAVAGQDEPAATPRRDFHRRVLAGGAAPARYRPPPRKLGAGDRVHRHGDRDLSGHRRRHYPDGTVPAAHHDHRPDGGIRRRPGRLLPPTMGIGNLLQVGEDTPTRPRGPCCAAPTPTASARKSTPTSSPTKRSGT